MEKFYCFLTAAALFPIFFNYRGEAQHKGTFLLLLQWPGIEPCKLASKPDTLATDPLGTIYIIVEISRSDKAFEESLNSCLWTTLLFHAAALFDTASSIVNL